MSAARPLGPGPPSSHLVARTVAGGIELSPAARQRGARGQEFRVGPVGGPRPPRLFFFFLFFLALALGPRGRRPLKARPHAAARVRLSGRPVEARGEPPLRLRPAANLAAGRPGDDDAAAIRPPGRRPIGGVAKGRRGDGLPLLSVEGAPCLRSGSTRWPVDSPGRVRPCKSRTLGAKPRRAERAHPAHLLRARGPQHGCRGPRIDLRPRWLPLPRLELSSGDSEPGPEP